MNKTEWRNFSKNHRVDEAQKVVQQDYLLKALWQILKEHQPTCVGLYAAIEGEVDYSTLSRKQLDDELNDALDRGDKKALDAISKELQKRNESVMLQIYGEEIQKMLRS